MEFVLTFEMTGGLKIAPKERLAYEIEELLHEYLENQDYGSGVLKFHIVLKLLNHEQSLAFPAGQFYRPRKKEVLFATLIEIEEALYSSEEAWKSIVCKTILDAVTRFGEVGVKHFDQGRFHVDLESFFREKGWLKMGKGLI